MAADTSVNTQKRLEQQLADLRGELAPHQSLIDDSQAPFGGLAFASPAGAMALATAKSESTRIGEEMKAAQSQLDVFLGAQKAEQDERLAAGERRGRASSILGGARRRNRSGATASSLLFDPSATGLTN